jgi:hypothetical protein
MCPACMASAALMAGSVVTTGGITALVAKMVGRNTGKTGVSNHLNEGSNDHGNIDEGSGTFEGRFTSGVAVRAEGIAEG